jgi:general secretion pathway protein I
MKLHPAHRQRGFTLIEVIIAFALLALALTLLLGSLSGASRQIRHADDASRAAMHAQSMLAQLGVGEVLQPGRSDGVLEKGRYRWTLAVAPYVDPLKPSAPTPDASAPRLLQVDLVVAWGDSAGQQLRLQSLRLAPADINQGAVPVP